MKKLILLSFFAAFLGFAANAQNKIHDAFNKSFGYEQYENYDKAIAALMEVYNEKNYVLNLRIGYLNYMKEDFNKSIKFYDKAIALKPNSIEARLGYVNPAYALGNMDNVIKKYEEILELDPHYTVVSYRLASIYFEKKDYDKAKGYVNAVLNLYPFDYYSNALMGYILKEKGDKANAISYWDIALMYNPNDQEIKDQIASLR